MLINIPHSNLYPLTLFSNHLKLLLNSFHQNLIDSLLQIQLVDQVYLSVPFDKVPARLVFGLFEYFVGLVFLILFYFEFPQAIDSKYQINTSELGEMTGYSVA